jgi:hypothetical protein
MLMISYLPPERLAFRLIMSRHHEQPAKVDRQRINQRSGVIVTERSNEVADCLEEKERCGYLRPDLVLGAEVHGVTDANARGSEPALRNGVSGGRTASGGFGLADWQIAGDGDGRARTCGAWD